MAITTQGGNAITTQAGARLVRQAALPPVMPPFGLDLTQFRIKVGLTANDTSRDTEIVGVINMALALMEEYCDRKFEYGPDTEYFTHLALHVLSLRRYPLESITVVNGAGNPLQIPTHHFGVNTGLLHFDNMVIAHTLEVQYVGGYKVLPLSLVMALLSVFGSVWDVAIGGGGISSGGIKTVRAGDLSITYDTGSGASISSKGAGFGGLIPVDAATLLDLYKREKA